jgi:hypothetical protein
LSYSHYLDYGGALFDRFPAAVRAMAARCKPSTQACPMRIVVTPRKEQMREQKRPVLALTPLLRIP